MSKLATVLVAAVLLSAGIASAASITGHYTITDQVTQLGPDQFKFEYTIHNIDQQAPGNDYTGLDGFLVYVPSTAVISDVIVPASYHGAPGQWVAIAGPISYVWWGMDPSSVYPAGTDAVFSFVADNVLVGQTNAVVSTYWAGFYPGPDTDPKQLDPNANSWYSQYDVTITGPVAVPLPSALSAGLSLGGISLLGTFLRRRQA